MNKKFFLIIALILFIAANAFAEIPVTGGALIQKSDFDSVTTKSYGTPEFLECHKSEDAINCKLKDNITENIRAEPNSDYYHDYLIVIKSDITDLTIDCDYKKIISSSENCPLIGNNGILKIKNCIFESKKTAIENVTQGRSGVVPIIRVINNTIIGLSDNAAIQLTNGEIFLNSNYIKANKCFNSNGRLETSNNQIFCKESLTGDVQKDTEIKKPENNNLVVLGLSEPDELDPDIVYAPLGGSYNYFNGKIRCNCISGMINCDWECKLTDNMWFEKTEGMEYAITLDDDITFDCAGKSIYLDGIAGIKINEGINAAIKNCKFKINSPKETVSAIENNSKENVEIANNELIDVSGGDHAITNYGKINSIKNCNILDYWAYGIENFGEIKEINTNEIRLKLGNSYAIFNGQSADKVNGVINTLSKNKIATKSDCFYSSEALTIANCSENTCTGLDNLPLADAVQNLTNANDCFSASTTTEVKKNAADTLTALQTGASKPLPDFSIESVVEDDKGISFVSECAESTKKNALKCNEIEYAITVWALTEDEAQQANFLQLYKDEDKSNFNYGTGQNTKTVSDRFRQFILKVGDNGQFFSGFKKHEITSASNDLHLVGVAEVKGKKPDSCNNSKTMNECIKKVWTGNANAAGEPTFGEFLNFINKTVNKNLGFYVSAVISNKPTKADKSDRVILAVTNPKKPEAAVGSQQAGAASSAVGAATSRSADVKAPASSGASEAPAGESKTASREEAPASGEQTAESKSPSQEKPVAPATGASESASEIVLIAPIDFGTGSGEKASADECVSCSTILECLACIDQKIVFGLTESKSDESRLNEALSGATVAGSREVRTGNR